ncbi:unnamed protein product [Arctia plantaginis]|uniref:Uncharacterized protein n=1 Tax=Arctia plantaginis TaxID=874455 RepID=A0A8S0YYC1_ARCPL|nr:unnamed protein product [Arctia plantaginis]CAB3250894.1 unnamed protein product [Arctia plantaginis]
MADDYDENTTVNADPINDNDDTPTTECQPNVNETTGFLQFNEIEKKECEESMTAAREHDLFNSNVIILGSIPPKDTQNCEQRPKRRKPNELEALGVTEVKDQFDSFSDDTNKIYRKYRLRNVSKPE